MVAPRRSNRIRIRAKLPYRLIQEGAWWVGHCPVLDVASQGKTERSALRNLRDALLLYIEGCLQQGTWGRVMAEAAFSHLDIDGQNFWIGGLSPSKLVSGPVLIVAGYIRADNPGVHERGRSVVRVPSVPPWTIRADSNGQAHTR